MQPTQTQQDTPQGGNQTTQLDPTVVNMARAIKSTETSGQSDPYTAVGASGEYGAYQYTPNTWAIDSQKYLGQEVPLQGATISQQNQVAYGKIQDLKNQGYSPLQVASIWNSGNPDPTGNVGTNKEGVAYNTPNYVNSVVNTYNAYKNGQTPTIQSTDSTVGGTQNQTPQSDEETLGQELQGRLGQAGQALTQASTGQINPVSGIIQTLGAAGGAVGDVTNKALELIPGVKWLEGELGKGVGDLAQTPVGQSIVSSLQSFSQAHPELSADIGAGFNIATAIPILKGLGTLADFAVSGAMRGLVSGAENGATGDLVSALSSTNAGRDMIAKDGANLLKTNVIKPRLMLADDFIDDTGGVSRYSTRGASKSVGKIISGIDDNELQPLLDRGSTTGVETRIPVTTLRQQATDEAVANLKDDGQVNKIFDRIQAKYGDYLSIGQQNEAKRLISRQVVESAFGSPEYNAAKSARSILQKSVEDSARQLGLGDVDVINQKMAGLIKTQDMLDELDGKKVKIPKAGFIKKGIRLGAKIAGATAGEGIGNAMGLPIVGTLAGGGLGGLAESGAERALGGGLIRNAILKRTGEESIAPTISKVLGRSAGLLGGALTQKLAK